MTVINLIPPDRLQQREARRRIASWSVRTGALVALLGGLYAGASHLAAGQSGEITTITSRYSSLQQRLKYARYLLGERERLASRQEAVHAIRDPLPAGLILETIGGRLTPESYLTYLSLQRDSGQIEDPNERQTPTLSLKGRAPGHTDVARIISNLSSAPGMHSVVLVATRDAPRREGRAREVEFELLCLLEEGGRM